MMVQEKGHNCCCKSLSSLEERACRAQAGAWVSAGSVGVASLVPAEKADYTGTDAGR